MICTTTSGASCRCPDQTPGQKWHREYEQEHDQENACRREISFHDVRRATPKSSLGDRQTMLAMGTGFSVAIASIKSSVKRQRRTWKSAPSK